jgi:uncharacterized protein YraI
MKLRFSMLLATIILSSTTTHAAAPDFYAVVGVAGWDTLNLRSTPSEYGPILKKIPFNGSGLRNMGKTTTGWCKVRYQNNVGWSMCSYLMADPQKHYYSAHGYPVPLPIQAQPQLNSPIVSRLPLEAENLVGLDNCARGWCKIDFHGKRGYVEQKYLVSTRPAKNPIVITPQPR